MRTYIKSLKTYLTRQRWFYRLCIQLQSYLYAACELISILASRILGHPVTWGVDMMSINESSELKYQLTVCLRFKNEGRYLAEWIDYHHRVGVDHFYLYNNNSTDDFREVLAPYISASLVTLHDWPGVPASPAADIHCITHYRNEAKWIAFIDADEFLFPLQENSLGPILRRFESFPGIAVNWIYFGSNGHTARPPGGVLANYTRRSETPNRHVKSIVNPRRVIKYGNPHYWFYSRAALPVNTARLPVYGSFSEPAHGDVLRINHYYSKSQEDFLDKVAMKSCADREGARFPSRRADGWKKIAAANNEVEDTTFTRIIRTESAQCATL